MFEHYLKLSVRELIKSKLFTTINLIGLSVGLSCTLYIILWVNFERSYDTYQDNYESIYILAQKESRQFWTPTTFKPYLEGRIPEISLISRIRKQKEVAVNVNNNPYLIKDIILADPEIFTLFTYKILKGNPEDPLPNPNSIVLTESIAKTIFGDKNPIGQLVTYENLYDMTVTAVVADLPNNTSIRHQAIAHFEALKEVYDPFDPDYNVLHEDGDWSFMTLVLVKPNTEISGTGDTIDQLIDQRYEWAQADFFLMPFKEYFFANVKGDYWGQHGNRQFNNILMIVALIIMILVGVNYINLSIARFAEKIKFFSINRLVGASKFDLLLKPILESILLVTLAFLLSITLLQYTGSFGNLHNIINVSLIHLTGILIALLFFGLITGICPAVYLLKYNRSCSFQRSFTNPASSGLLRKFLLVFQYIISVGMLVITLFVSHQIDFLKNSELGFNRQSVVFLKSRFAAISRADLLKQELLTYPEIKSVSLSDGLPGDVRNGNYFDHENKRSFFNDIHTDPDYIKTLGLEIIQGRNFFWDHPGDFKNEALIVNETAVKEFGWKNPLQMSIYGRPVVGVMKDFYFRSMHQSITPVMLRCSRQFRTINIRIDTRDITSTIKNIKNSWMAVVPNLPFELEFLDNAIQEMYRSEVKFGTLLRTFTIISILISFLGIFGLSSFFMEKRTKEIGIRKVLGATVSGIIFMLNKEFIRMVLIANFIAWPIAYFAVNRWLQNFAYHIEIARLPFLLSGLIVLILTLITVSGQAIRAATANPVESLKYE